MLRARVGRLASGRRGIGEIAAAIRTAGVGRPRYVARPCIYIGLDAELAVQVHGVGGVELVRDRHFIDGDVLAGTDHHAVGQGERIGAIATGDYPASHVDGTRRRIVDLHEAARQVAVRVHLVDEERRRRHRDPLTTNHIAGGPDYFGVARGDGVDFSGRGVDDGNLGEGRAPGDDSARDRRAELIARHRRRRVWLAYFDFRVRESDIHRRNATRSKTSPGITAGNDWSERQRQKRKT